MAQNVKPRPCRASLAWRSLSSRRDLDRRRRQLRALLRARDEGRTVPVRLAPTRRKKRVASRCRSRPTWSGTAFCPTCGRTSSTATASTARTSPQHGHRFNPNKVVLDPYAKSVARTIRWADEMFGYARRPPGRRPVVRRRATTRAFAPLAAVVDPAFTWGDDRPPRTPWHNTVIYEMHVRGFSKRHPDIPERCAAPTKR